MHKNQMKKSNRWNDEDITLLIKLYSTTTNKNLAIKLDKSLSSVEKKGNQLGLSKDKEFRKEINKRNASLNSRCKIWTNKEITFLKKNYKKMSGKEIAKRLNRTYASIINKCQQLGLNKNKKYSKKNYKKNSSE